MQEFKVNVTDIDSFHLIPGMRKYIKTFKDREISEWNAFEHSLDPQTIKLLHLRVESLVCKNVLSNIDCHGCNTTKTNSAIHPS